MDFTKKCISAIVFMAAATWAGELRSNVCDTLVNSSHNKVKLVPAYIDETMWYGDKTLSVEDSSTSTRHADYTTMKALHNRFTIGLPVEVNAGCFESYNQASSYALWSKNKGSMYVNDGNTNFATFIMDSRAASFGTYDEKNSYNILIWTQTNELNGSYRSGDVMVSTTYDFQFQWWYAAVSYTITKETTTVNGGETTTTVSRTYNIGESSGFDSSTVVVDAVKALTIPDSVTKLELKVFHAVLVDERTLKQEESSSSSKVDVPASSSEQVVSSSSVSAESSSAKAESSSAKDESSSSISAESSSTKAESSSSISETSSSSVSVDPASSASADPGSSEDEGDLTSFASLKDVARLGGNRLQVRRLDGSRVSAHEALVPGIYYVKGENGLWKKQMVLPR